MSVLHPIIHARLIADLPAICARANVPVSAVTTSAVGVLDDEAMAWVKSLQLRPGVVEGRGAIFVGADAEDKIIAIAAVFLRNHLDARIMSVNTMLDDHDKQQPTVALIPNLYVRGQGQALPPWKQSALYDILLQRKAAGLLTLGYVEDMQALKKDYGTVFERHLRNNYVLLGGG